MPSPANPVNWFEIPVTDMTRAKTFYEAVLSVDITDSEMGPNKMGWFPMEMGAPGAAGTLIQGEGYNPSHDGSLVYLHVDKIDSALETVGTAGGKVLMPRIAIGEHGFIAHFEDTEGNRVALHEYPETSDGKPSDCDKS
jgi:predicted enzyme related to lactoylglutathione lyase